MDEMQVTCEVDGIPVVIDRSRLSDFDTLEMFYDLQTMAESWQEGEEDPDGMLLVVPFARALFGNSQWKRIKQTLREDGGEQPHILRCVQFIFDAMKAASETAGGDLKN